MINYKIIAFTKKQKEVEKNDFIISKEKLVETLIFYLQQNGYDPEIFSALEKNDKTEQAVLALCEYLQQIGKVCDAPSLEEMQENLQNRETTIQFLILGLQGVRPTSQKYSKEYQEKFKKHSQEIENGISLQVRRLLDKSIKNYRDSFEWIRGWQNNGIFEYCKKIIEIFQNFRWRNPQTMETLSYILSRWYDQDWFNYFEKISKDNPQAQKGLVLTMMNYLEFTNKESYFTSQYKNKPFEYQETILIRLLEKLCDICSTNEILKREIHSKLTQEIFKSYLSDYYSQKTLAYLQKTEEYPLLFEILSKSVSHYMMLLNQFIPNIQSKHDLVDYDFFYTKNSILASTMLKKIQNTLEMLKKIAEIQEKIPKEDVLSFKDNVKKNIRQIYEKLPLIINSDDNRGLASVVNKIYPNYIIQIETLMYQLGKVS